VTVVSIPAPASALLKAVTLSVLVVAAKLLKVMDWVVSAPVFVVVFCDVAFNVVMPDNSAMSCVRVVVATAAFSTLNVSKPVYFRPRAAESIMLSAVVTSVSTPLPALIEPVVKMVPLVKLSLPADPVTAVVVVALNVAVTPPVLAEAFKDVIAAPNVPIVRAAVPATVTAFKLASLAIAVSTLRAEPEEVIASDSTPFAVKVPPVTPETNSV